MTAIKDILGDYQAFAADLFCRLDELQIDVTGLPIVQLLYRVETQSEYESVRDQLKPHCKQYVETLFNGRAVAILVLKEPLYLERGFSVSVIELPAPRAVHMYPTGLESLGIYVGKELASFKERYHDRLTGTKEHGPYCQPAFVTFDTGKTVKFYDHTLEEIVLLQGWRLETQNDPLAELVNAWRWYLYSLENWRDLITASEPRKTDCRLIYELRSHRPNESFAIVEMNAPTHPHFHRAETEIYFVLEGKGKMVIDGKEMFIEKDNTVIIPPETPHHTIPLSTLVIAVVNTPPFKSENYELC